MDGTAGQDEFDISEFMELFSDKFKRSLKIHAEPFLKEHNIRVHHIIFISLIGRYEGISQKDLKTHVPYDKSRVSMVITELIFMGLIRDASPGKTSSLYLTDKGKEIFSESKKISKSFKNELITDISADEIETLKAVLIKIDANMERLLENE